MNLLHLMGSWIRVGLCLVWTAMVGLPLVLLVYARYLIGVVRRWLGDDDALERQIDRNVLSLEFVGRELFAPGIFKLTRMSFSMREESPIDWRRTHVICANHTSLFDVMALMSAVPVPMRFVAKRELTWWPVIGWVLKPSGQIIVDRDRRSSAIRSISAAALAGVRGQIVFFVEGTRSQTGELLPFKKGAFHFALANDLPLLPTAIGGAHRALARTAWWKLNPGSEIFVDFCTPIETARAGAEAELSDLVDELSERTRAAISGALEAHPTT